ncbi:type I iodothyronine deiodinase-like [Montipora capricornis]|uniref:type I iodothyronine deiodinase-like n=1 Tax=Montipora capricornis TaxID=246305 RepID=UPI0035F123B4
MMLRKMSTVFRNCAGTVLLFCAFLCLRILRIVPFSKRIVAKLGKTVTTLDLPIDDYWGSLFSWNMFQSVRSTILGDLQKSARFGQRAPNPSVVTLDGVSHPHLLNFCRGNRPLVLNFGSWSCPVFRARTKEFLEIAHQFHDVADFLTVYIEEAHPSNGWAFENNVNIPKHETLEQRCQAARLMLSSFKFDCPVVVDTMDDEASKAYGGFPIRLYILKNNKVEYAGAIGPTFYAPKEVKQWLKKHKAESSKSERQRA